jgi:hypothetical protein
MAVDISACAIDLGGTCKPTCKFICKSNCKFPGASGSLA